MGVRVYNLIGLAIKNISLVAFVGAIAIISRAGSCFMLGYLIYNFLLILNEHRMIYHTNVECECEREGGIIIRSLTWIFETIRNALDFVAETVRMTYKQECPLIIWGDETGPIEKHNK